MADPITLLASYRFGWELLRPLLSQRNAQKDQKKAAIKAAAIADAGESAEVIKKRQAQGVLVCYWWWNRCRGELVWRW